MSASNSFFSPVRSTSSPTTKSVYSNDNMFAQVEEGFLANEKQ